MCSHRPRYLIGTVTPEDVLCKGVYEISGWCGGKFRRNPTTGDVARANTADPAACALYHEELTAILNHHLLGVRTMAKLRRPGAAGCCGVLVRHRGRHQAPPIRRPARCARSDSRRRMRMR